MALSLEQIQTEGKIVKKGVFILCALLLVTVATAAVASPGDHWTLRGGIGTHNDGLAVGLDYRGYHAKVGGTEVLNLATLDYIDTRDRHNLVSFDVGREWKAGRLVPRATVGVALDGGTNFDFKVGGLYRFSDNGGVFLGYGKNGVHAHGKDGSNWLLQASWDI